MKVEAKVSVRVSNQQLWDKFHAYTTEMVVTQSGRKMFPKLEYLIEGLEPDAFYALCLQIEQVDDNRYKFNEGKWKPAGRGDPPTARPKAVRHSDGLMPGSNWMRGPVNFEKVKITNNTKDECPSHIILNSMHKYIPVLTIFKVAEPHGGIHPAMPVSSEPPAPVAVFRVECTEFIAVTAYQNQTITQLKIEHNPFAKGFRDGGASSLERKRSTSSPSDSSTPSPKRLSLSHPSESPLSGRFPWGMPGSPMFVGSPLLLPSTSVPSSLPSSFATTSLGRDSPAGKTLPPPSLFQFPMSPFSNTLPFYNPFFNPLLINQMLFGAHQPPTYQ